MSEMGKVDISEAKATITARGGHQGESQRGDDSKVTEGNLAKSSKVEKNVGVNMSAKESSADQLKQKPGKKAASEVRATGVNSGAKPKRLALTAGSNVDNVKPKKNIVVHDELDAGMALMADRSAAAEYQKVDITKIKQQRGKSMSGMLMDVSRNSAHAAEQSSEKTDATVAEKNTKTAEVNPEKERFSKMGSTLIGVGVALVVAVIGFAAIAIFGNNKEKCTVAFESNGGSKVESAEIVCGRTVSRPNDPTKDGFEFEGWIFEGDPFDFSTGVYKSATLVAKWKANEETEIVKVSFDTDGGSTVSPVEAAKGKTVEKPNNPTKTNWAFTGWYLDGKEFDFSTPIERDITLKANWRWAPVSTGNGGGNSGNSGNNGNTGNSGNNNNGGGGTTENNPPAIDDENKPDDGKTENPSNPGGSTGDGGEDDEEDKGDGSGDSGAGSEGGTEGGDGSNTGSGTGGDDNTGSTGGGTGGTGTGEGDTTPGGEVENKP